jgi:hypothetical protein
MKKHFSGKLNYTIRLSLMVVIAISILVISACSGSIQTPLAPTSTPTTTVEPVDSGPIPTEESTKIPLDIPTEDPNLEPTATNIIEDVCSLATAFDIENVLDQTITSTTPGAEPDEVTDSTLNYCTFVGSDKAVVISSVEVENSFIGGDVLRDELQKIQDEEPNTKSNEELGVGIRAFWSTSEHGAEYTVLTETHVFSVALGGNIGSADDHKAALLTLVQIVAEKQ